MNVKMNPLKYTFLMIGIGIIAGLPITGLAKAMPLSDSAFFIPVNASGGHLISQGHIIGKPYFPKGDNISGGHGQTIDGIKANSVEQMTYHIHVHLSLINRGHQIAVPAGIGILPPWQTQHGFISGGSKIYWLHTHDATGIIHIESPVHKIFTLGQFFDIWGMPLKPDDVAGLKGQITAYVNGKPYHQSLRNIPLTAHKQITLEIGKPVIKPPQYVFPQGL